MTAPVPAEAPPPAPATDIRVGDDTAAQLLQGERPGAGVAAGSDAGEQTVDTPDELGGTGGEQPGGAG